MKKKTNEEHLIVLDRRDDLFKFQRLEFRIIIVRYSQSSPTKKKLCTVFKEMANTKFLGQ